MRLTTRISAVLVLCGCSFIGTLRAEAQAPPPPPPPQMAEGPAINQVRAGDALLAQGHYREAAQQYEAAYAIDPALPILERLADAYRLAGDTERAMVLYQRIAAARGQQSAPPPPPPPQYVNPSQPIYYAPSMTATVAPRRPGQGLINAGVGLLVAGYGMGVVGGAITMGATYATRADSHWYGAGGMLLVPVFGPFATLAYERSVYWAAPWAIVSGGMQLGGLALLIAGAAVRGSHKPTAHAAAPAAERPKSFTWNLSPYQNPQGGGMLLSGTF